MGYSETDSSNCRRHPNHKQSPGVCPSCLRDKLSKLNTSSPSFTPKKPYIISDSSSLSSTPPYSDASSTTTTTNTTTAATATAIGTRKSQGSRHRRNGSETYVSVGLVLNNGLKKSRSVSCAPLSSRNKLGANDVITEKLKSCVNGGGGEVDNNNNNNKEGKKKNNGFLKKLIHSTSKKTKGVLMHSKTMKERSHPSTYIASNNNATNK